MGLATLKTPRQRQTTFKRLKRRWSWVSPCARALSPLSESWMQEICPSSLMSGIWKRRHGQIFRHRQPKGSVTVKAEPNSTAPDLDSTLSRGLPGGLAKSHEPTNTPPPIWRVARFGVVRYRPRTRASSEDCRSFRVGSRVSARSPKRMIPQKITVRMPRRGRAKHSA